jgi:subfamily B ATP-binding cassette protein HlyB/CyaB
LSTIGIKLWDEVTTLDAAFASLSGTHFEHSVLREMGKSLIISKALEEYGIPHTVDKDARDKLVLEFCREKKFKNDQALIAWLKANNSTPEQLIQTLIHAARIEQLKRSVITEQEVSELFLQRKSKLDRVTFHLIRASSEQIAQELHRRVQAGQDFSMVAKEVSIGPEAQQGGLIGPKPVHELNPELRAILLELKPGELTEPFTLDGQAYLIARLQYIEQARLTPELSIVLRNELFEQWITRQLSLLDARCMTLPSSDSKDVVALAPELSTGHCLEHALKSFGLPVPSHPLSNLTLPELTKALEQNGLQVQQKAFSWGQLLNQQFPFVFEDESGQCHWITGRKGNTLLSAKKRLVPEELGKPRIYKALFVSQPDTSRMEEKFGYRWYLWSLFRKADLSFQMILASCFTQIFSLGLPVFYMIIFDRVFGRQNLSTLDVMSVGLLIVMSADMLVKYLRSYVLSHQLEAIDKEVVKQLLQKVFYVPLSTANSDLIKGISERYSELVKMNQGIVTTLLITSMDVAFSSVIAVVLFLLHWQLAGISLAAIVPIIAITIMTAPQVRERALAFSKRQRACQMRLVEAIHHAEAIHSLSAMERLKGQIYDLTVKCFEKSFGARYDRVSGSQLQGFIINAGSVATLYFGAHAVLQGEISYGVYMALNMLSRNVVSSVQRLLQAITQFQEAAGSIEQFKELYAKPDESQSKPGTLHLEEVSGRIIFRDVYFRYRPEDKWVLNGVNLEILPGEKIILAGKSGAGKTTLIRLLQRLYEPTSGLITLERFNIADMDLAFLRNTIGVVLQKPSIFSGSIRENLLLGNPHASMKDIANVVDFAQLEEFITRIPGGLDAELAHLGGNLSGGQAARIALARVLLANPQILVLDEGLSALEPASTKAIFAQIFERFQHKTCLFVTDYRPAHERADRILVLHEGQIAESGTYAELMRLKGYYYHLYQEDMTTGYEKKMVPT